MGSCDQFGAQCRMWECPDYFEIDGAHVIKWSDQARHSCLAALACRPEHGMGSACMSCACVDGSILVLVAANMLSAMRAANLSQRHTYQTLHKGSRQAWSCRAYKMTACSLNLASKVQFSQGFPDVVPRATCRAGLQSVHHFWLVAEDPEACTAERSILYTGDWQDSLLCRLVHGQLSCA